MRSGFVHSYYSKKVLAEKPLWVCRNFMVKSVFLSPHGPLHRHRISAASPPWDGWWACPSPRGLCNSSSVGSMLLWVLFTLPTYAEPAPSQSRIKMSWAAQCKRLEGQDGGDRSLFIALGSLGHGKGHPGS